MSQPKVSMIAAIGSNREIGRDNRLLWHIPDDFKRFKEITLGHPVVMGRVTFESLGKPLPGRINIVVTRNKKYQADGCQVCYSLKAALRLASKKDKEEVFIIGGGQIYKQGIKYADKLYLTIVEGNFKADTFFPDYSEFKECIFRKKGNYKDYRYTFLELTK